MPKLTYSRREMLQLSAAAASTFTLPPFTKAAQPETPNNLYAHLLQTWCDGLLAHQVSAITNPGLHGALLCPACAMIHGRCGDAVYPLLHVAHTTGNAKYLQAAISVHDWSEQQVSRADGSWINDVLLSSWKGITVFHAISLAEALQHHGTLLDAATRQRWTDRLARAARFLDGFITIDTGNINYPVTSTHCFALCGQVLGDNHYLDRAHELAHQALDHFTPNNLLFGEGHPQTGITPKHCRPIDLGYNVEESLPALAQYALLTNDQPVLDQVVSALRAHMEFMLPDGAWDNSWGSRNYKWTWWGSRTSDGCHPAYVLLAQHDPRFLEVAQRNLELMASCTHNGLLYGGPDYFLHGDLPCIHHTFTHAKALATVLDNSTQTSAPRQSLPRDQPYGLKSYPEIATHLAAIGSWRATVTAYDFEYIEHAQPQGGGPGSGGHATGGALTLLYHRTLGPILTASMTEYQIIEVSNQQTFRDAPHMCLTPRIECNAGQTYTSLSDLEAILTTNSTPGEITFEARGRLLTTAKHPLPNGDIHYHLTYRLTESTVEILANTDATTASSLRLIVPVISGSTEAFTQPDPKTLRITKPKGTLTVSTPQDFEPIPKERTFNLVPGFECIPLIINIPLNQQIQIRFEAA
jgi:hypothetical protein